MKGSQATTESSGMNVLVGPLQGTDLSEADRIFRVPLGLFWAFPIPMNALVPQTT
jgi:hypothetical protein